MPLFFISDLHLSILHKDSYELFKYFFKYIVDNKSSVYILGDWFEYWVGDDNLQDFSLEIAQIISDKVKAGVDCYFLPGNRDFLIGKRFLDRCGIKLIQEKTIVTWQNYRLLLMHGDLLCVDHKYLIYKKIVQSRLFKSLFLSLSFKIRNKIALYMRGYSRNSNKYSSSLTIDGSLVNKLLKEYNANILVHGHIHLPGVHILQDGLQRIVLGDWHKEADILKLDDSGINLINIKE